MRFVFFGAIAIALAGITYSIAPGVARYVRINTM
jgi:hypothetical protein